MPKCHDRRKRKQKLNRREKRREFHRYHRFISLLPPYSDVSLRRANINKRTIEHYTTQVNLNNFTPLQD